MRQTIAIYGGAFDPPTMAHAHVVNAVLDHCDVDFIDICPSYNHRFKSNSVTFENRLDMCELGFNRLGATVKEVEKIVFEVGGDGSTRALAEYYIELAKDPKSLYYGDLFAFVIGVDNADSISTWKDPDWLIENVSFIVIPRGGYEPQKTWYRSGKHQYLDNIMPIDFSSSMARQEISQGNIDSLHMVNEDVLDYIRDKKLYISTDH